MFALLLSAAHASAANDRGASWAVVTGASSGIGAAATGTGGGTAQLPARWAVCVSRTERALGFALSRRFVDTSLGRVREPAVPPLPKRWRLV